MSEYFEIYIKDRQVKGKGGRGDEGEREKGERKGKECLTVCSVSQAPFTAKREVEQGRRQQDKGIQEETFQKKL